MKSNMLVRQILIAAAFVLLFTIGLAVILFVTGDRVDGIVSVSDFQGATGVVFASKGNSVGADCPLYSLGDKKYIALFDRTCALSFSGLMNDVEMTRDADVCEIKTSMRTGKYPVESACEKGDTYEFFGGTITFYPLEDGKIAVIFLMNHAENAAFETVGFGSVGMKAAEYHNAFMENDGDLRWDEENQVYVNEFGEVIDRRTAPEYEIPALWRTNDKDASCLFYLNDPQYASLMRDKVFELRGAEGGVLSALFWEKEG